MVPRGLVILKGGGRRKFDFVDPKFNFKNAKHCAARKQLEQRNNLFGRGDEACGGQAPTPGI